MQYFSLEDVKDLINQDYGYNTRKLVLKIGFRVYTKLSCLWVQSNSYRLAVIISDLSDQYCMQYFSLEDVKGPDESGLQV